MNMTTFKSKEQVYHPEHGSGIFLYEGMYDNEVVVEFKRYKGTEKETMVLNSAKLKKESNN